MLVKRYLVKEMPEAVAMIREDLGKDAVILSTKKVQSRGFFGLFAKKQIEVVAAANEQEPKPERNASLTQAAPVLAPTAPRQAALGAYQQNKSPKPLPATAEFQATDSGETYSIGTQSTETHSTKSRSFETHGAVPASTAPTTAPTTTPTTTKETFVHPTESAMVAPAPHTPRAEERADAQVLKEVQELRSMIRTFMRQSNQSLFPEPVVKMRKQLLENDFDEEMVDVLIEKGIREIQQVQEISEQEFRDILTNFINEELSEVSPPAPMLSTTRVASFLGPTGVGKTTTIAKLAAEQVLNFGKKVGLITTDTYRIAAVEQLRTYANILNVPLEVCYSPEDIHRAMEKFADRDLILVDTAGRNFSNELHVRELKSYLQILQPDETYLVLSLTTRATDLAKIVSNFAQVPINKFLFTKADETSSYGAIYNLALRYKIPLSYVTTGQNVPDDIEVVTTEKLAGLLVGANSDV